MIIGVLAITHEGKEQLINLDAEFLRNAATLITNVICDPSVYVGSAVRMQGDGSAVNALADSYENANVIGIVESKINSTLCNVRVSGVTQEIFNSLDVTKEYYLHDSIPGMVSTFIPVTTGHIRLKIGQPFSDKKMVIIKGERLIRG